MQYFGGKLSAAQLQVAGWVGSVRRSLQGALGLVWGPAEEKQQEEEEEDKEEEEEGGDGGGRFQRAMSPLRSFARRSRRSLRRFSVRSRQTLQRRATETCSAPVNIYSTNSEDTDALIDNEPDQQNEASERTSEIDSPKPIADQAPEVSTEDLDETDYHREPELPPFPESSTPLLDTSAQRSKADLGRRRSRSRPSRSVRMGLVPLDSPDWRTRDSTDEREASKQRDSDSEDEQPKPKMAYSPPSASHRVPVFPGLSPAALLAQIKKKTSGGSGEDAEEEKARDERESQNEEEAPSSSQVSRSPRSAAHLAGAARVLPPIGGADRGAASSPAWLKELKSKKRLSQHEGEA